MYAAILANAGGIVVAYAPATGETRVQFPAGVLQVFFAHVPSFGNVILLVSLTQLGKTSDVDASPHLITELKVLVLYSVPRLMYS